MDINFGHVSIINKKISLFARAVLDIFIFFGKPTFRPPCIYIYKTLDIKIRVYVYKYYIKSSNKRLGIEISV